MSVYVDPLMPSRQYHESANKRWNWSENCHMTADTERELHAMADELKLKRAWFQRHHPNPVFWHYDLTANKRRQAISCGAIELSWDQWSNRIQKETTPMTTSTPPALLNLTDLSSRIDIQGFYERQGVVIFGTPTTHYREGREWHGSCPECGGENRFAFWATGRFSCSLRSSGCGIHGNSPYWFLRDVKGFNHQQALEELGIAQEEISDSYSQQNGHMLLKLPLFLISDEPPCSAWQDAAYVFCQICEKIFWGSKGESARNYLHSRGFSDETIKSAHLGLCPDWFKAPLENWGLEPEQLMKTDDPLIKIPRGITIPWFVGASIHKIQLRRPDGQYFQVLGSSDCLYSIDSIEPGQPVLLVESEFDALSAHQEASDLVCCVATGSTTKAQHALPIAQLLQASHVLQSFDDDEAGEAGAQEWIRLLGSEKCTRHTPWAHDVNDMLREGLPVRHWIKTGLEGAEQGEEQPTQFFDVLGKSVPAELVERMKAFQRAPCAHCGGNDWFIDIDGLLTCPCIIPKRNANLAMQRIARLVEDW